MFKKETRACKPDKETREWLVLLACAFFVSNFLYAMLNFKGIPSQNIKFTDQRQFVSVDRKPDVSTTVNNDASYEIEEVSTMVNEDASYEIEQDASTVVNKYANDAVNKDVSYELKQDASTMVNKFANDAVNKNDRNQSLQYLLTRLVAGDDRTKLDSTGFACDINSWSTVCVTNKPVIINTSTMQVHLQPSPDTENATTIIRPYAIYPNEHTTQVTITTTKPTRPTCDHNHQHPAVIFSTDGFTGNLFHDFNENIIPLFITTRLFKSRVHFLVVDHKPSFIHKYRRVFSRLSDHEIINTATDSSVHCFPGAIIGLKFHNFMGINTSETPQNYYSMPDFREFMRQTYKLKTKSIFNTQNPPRLLLISRQRTRKFLNQEEIVKMMEELGFQVIIASSEKQMSNIEKFSPVVNSCSVMVGVHGAGLTNILFLPDGGVVIQVRPLGFHFGVDAYFSEPAPGMGLKYLEYKMEPEESSLADVYGLDHPVVKDIAAAKGGYAAAKAMYLDKQDLKLNVNRFRETLVEALGFIGRHKDVNSR